MSGEKSKRPLHLFCLCCLHSSQSSFLHATSELSPALSGGATLVAPFRPMRAAMPFAIRLSIRPTAAESIPTANVLTSSTGARLSKLARLSSTRHERRGASACLAADADARDDLTGVAGCALMSHRTATPAPCTGRCTVPIASHGRGERHDRTLLRTVRPLVQKARDVPHTRQAVVASRDDARVVRVAVGRQRVHGTVCRRNENCEE